MHIAKTWIEELIQIAERTTVYSLSLSHCLQRGSRNKYGKGLRGDWTCAILPLQLQRPAIAEMLLPIDHKR